MRLRDPFGDKELDWFNEALLELMDRHQAKLKPLLERGDLFIKIEHLADARSLNLRMVVIPQGEFDLP